MIHISVRSRRVLGSFFFIIFLLSPALAHADNAAAASYLATHATSPWSIMALAATGSSPDPSSLQNTAGDTAIELEAPILALIAAGEDPRTYPAHDLVAELQAFYAGGQIGDPATLNDDIFGVLALYSAGVPADDATIAGTRSFILAHQNSDGGWPFQAGGTSDTNTTAAAVMALIASGSSAGDAPIVSALGYLQSAQNSDGGFPYDPKSPWGTGSDASSDAWVIMALRAAGANTDGWQATTTAENLLAMQDPVGFFQFQPGSGEDSFSAVTTAYALLALSGKTLPVRVLPPPPPPPPPPPAPAPAPAGGGGGGPIAGPMSFGYEVAPQTPTTTPDLASTTADASTSSPPAATTTTMIATTSTPAVLGAESYAFTANLGFGARGTAVAELQQILINAHLLAIVAPTGWFGPLTREAVRAYQGQHHIPQTGFVGPLTRATLTNLGV